MTTKVAPLRKIDIKHCSGCEQDFYNGHNPYGIEECWCRKTARLITRFRISVDAPMGNRRNYEKKRVPNCYEQKRFVFLDQIPNYATEGDKW